jgi:hypothetical protein
LPICPSFSLDTFLKRTFLFADLSIIFFRG